MIYHGLPWFTNLYTDVYKESKDVAFRTGSCQRVQHSSASKNVFKLSESLPFATFCQGTQTPHLSPFRKKRSIMFECKDTKNMHKVKPFKPVVLGFWQRICQGGFAQNDHAQVAKVVVPCPGSSCQRETRLVHSAHIW